MEILMSGAMGDVFLGVILPKVIGFVTSRIPAGPMNDYYKKRVAWIACLLVALASTAASGAFAPVMVSFSAGTSVAAFFHAAGVLVGILVAKWGLITVTASQMYDKVYHTEGKIKEEATKPQSVKDTLITQVRTKGAAALVQELQDVADKFGRREGDKTPSPVPPYVPSRDAELAGEYSELVDEFKRLDEQKDELTALLQSGAQTTRPRMAIKAELDATTTRKQAIKARMVEIRTGTAIPAPDPAPPSMPVALSAPEDFKPQAGEMQLVDDGAPELDEQWIQGTGPDAPAHHSV